MPDAERGLLLALGELGRELPQQAGLSDPCLADDGHEVRPLLANDPVEQGEEKR